MPDPARRNVIDEVAESYEGAPDEIRNIGIERLLTGLDRYGDAHFLDAHTEAEWLHEALEELLDAFNMLVGMRIARGEKPIARGSISRAIHIVHMALLDAVAVPPPRPGEGAGGGATAADEGVRAPEEP